MHVLTIESHHDKTCASLCARMPAGSWRGEHEEVQDALVCSGSRVMDVVLDQSRVLSGQGEA